MSFSNGFPGNIVPKSTSCAIIHGVELLYNLIFIKTYDTQKLNQSVHPHPFTFGP